RAAHAAVESAAQESLKKAHHAGKGLLVVKERVGHGNFEPWLKANCPFSPSTARLYMKIAGEVDLERVGDLSLREVAKRLYASDKDEAESTEPGSPEPVGRITKDYETELIRCLRAIHRAQQYPERLAKNAKVIHKR